VAELPIIVEVSPWIGLVFGGGVIALALRLAWNVIRSMRTGGMSAMTARQGVTVLVMLGVGLVLILRDVGWQLRLDDKGSSCARRSTCSTTAARSRGPTSSRRKS